jgi:hypothetical protein
MRIYNYLFYKSFVLAEKSRNFEDIPVLGGLMFLSGIVMFNIFTVIGFLEVLEVNTGIDFKLQYKYPFGFGLFGLLLFYYSYKGRYKKIVAYYKEKENGKRTLHPILVIISYILVSVMLLFLVGFYKHKIWFFA